jgi:hypothetical protein
MNCTTEVRDTTKSKYVFLAALGAGENKFRIEESQPIRFEAPEQVFDTSTWEFLTTGLYDLGSMGSNFIVGTKGDGTSAT